MRRLLLAVATALLVLAHPVPAAQAQSGPACQVAAESARDALAAGAIYSQGGYLANDPINPLTGLVWPRTGPDSFDCSGLVWWAYQQAGIEVGSTTHEQRYAGDWIPCTLDDLNGAFTTCWAPGDLIFASSSTGQHVALYIGEGLFADCYNHEVDCVVHGITTDSYYQQYFWQARRPVSGCESLTVDPGSPTPLYPTTPRLLEEINGIVAPVRLVAPYECSSCGGEATNVLQPLDDDLLRRSSHWSDFGVHIDWLAVQLWNRITLPLVCWLLVALQSLLNAYSVMLNTWGEAINQIWRLLVLWFLSSRSSLEHVWLLLEELRDIAWQQQALLWQFESYMRSLLDAMQKLINLLSDLTLVYVNLAATPISALKYVVALFVGTVPGMLLVFQDPGAYEPAPLATIGGNPIFQMFTGAVDGVADTAGWWWSLFIALYYGFFLWLFIGEAKRMNG